MCQYDTPVAAQLAAHEVGRQKRLLDGAALGPGVVGGPGKPQEAERLGDGGQVKIDET